MRILVINPNTSEAITKSMVDYLAGIFGEAVVFVPATGRFGARYISSRAAAAIAGHAALDALATHAAGCDAVYLACFGDPGLAALKEVSPIPVIGMAEAACVEAARDGRRFGIVTGGALWKPMLEEFVATLGLSHQLAGVQTVAPTGDQIARDPDAALSVLAEACEVCARSEGAEIIILGGAALAGLNRKVQLRVDTPVLCSVEAGAKAAIAGAMEKRRNVRAAPPIASIGLSSALTTLIGGQ